MQKYWVVLGLLIGLFAGNMGAQGVQPVARWTFEGSQPEKGQDGRMILGPGKFRTNAVSGRGKVLLNERNREVLRCPQINKAKLSNEEFSVEMAIRPGREYIGGTFFDWKNRAALRADGDGLSLQVFSADSVYRLEIPFNGSGPRSPFFLTDGDWHLISLTVNGRSGWIRLYLDGQLAEGFSQRMKRDTKLKKQGFFFLGGRLPGEKFIGEIDEVSLYQRELKPDLVWQHMQDFESGEAFEAVARSKAPTRKALPTLPDPREFPPGYPTVQLQPAEMLASYPAPRYQPGHRLPRLVPWVPHWRQLTANISSNKIKQNEASVLIQKELIRNWNYALMLGTLYQARGEANLRNPKQEVSHFVQLANDPEFADVPRGLLVNWHQARPSIFGGEKIRPKVTQGTHRDEYYYRDKAGKPLTKRPMLSMAAPVQLAVDDGKIQAALLRRFFRELDSPHIDFIAENGEIQPHPIPEAKLEKDPRIVSDRSSMNLKPTWADYLALRKTRFRQTYLEQFLPVIDSANKSVGKGLVKTYWYALSGNRTGIYEYGIARNALRTWEDKKHRPMPYFYPQKPKYWRYHTGALAGIHRILVARKHELAAGDSIYSPIISPGFTDGMQYRVKDEDMIRPGQYLGLLKALGALGADHFLNFIYHYAPNKSMGVHEPEWRTWKFSTPAYAQAIMSRAEDLLYQGQLLEGDKEFDEGEMHRFSLYTFHAGNRNNLVIIRKANRGERFFIVGAAQVQNNVKGTLPEALPVEIMLEGKPLRFSIRKQGSCYIYDRSTPSQPVFYQLDGWHEPWDPHFWSHAFEFEAELADQFGVGMKMKTERKAHADSRDFVGAETWVKSPSLRFSFRARQSDQAALACGIRLKNTSGQTEKVEFYLNGIKMGEIKVPANKSGDFVLQNSKGSPIVLPTSDPTQTYQLEIRTAGQEIWVDKVRLEPLP